MKKKIIFSDVSDIIMEELSIHFDKTGIDPSSFDEDTDLFKCGLIDSLDFLELIEVLEKNHALLFDFSNVLDLNISILKVFINEVVRQNIQLNDS